MTTRCLCFLSPLFMVRFPLLGDGLRSVLSVQGYQALAESAPGLCDFRNVHPSTEPLNPERPHSYYIPELRKAKERGSKEWPNRVKATAFCPVGMACKPKACNHLCRLPLLFPLFQPCLWALPQRAEVCPSRRHEIASQ